MPTYDFICNSCKQRFDIFLTYKEYGVKTVRCVHCGSEDIRRRMTKVRIAKTEEGRLEDMAGNLGDLGGMENDPASFGKMMKKMGKEMGEDLPAGFDEVVERLEAGQSPEEIESALPDLGDADSDDS